MSEQIVLEVKNVVKTYGSSRALDDISFKLEKGKILGLLGENGAGKSTVISIMTGELAYDKGEILYKGKPIEACKKDFQSVLGYVPQEIALFYDLSCMENLIFWGHLYNLKGDSLLQRIEEVSRNFELEDVMNKRLDRISGGYQRRLNLACAILHRPELLFLDEPTVGIDVSIRKKILKIVRSFAEEEGMAILYTSHYIDELQEISDHVLMIKKGKNLSYLNRKDFADSSLENLYLGLS